MRDPKSKLWCKNLLEHGAAATLGPVAEPYTIGFPKPAEFFGTLVTGDYTLVETYWRTEMFASWMTVLVGDPLYNPYLKSPKLKIGQVKPSPAAQAVSAEERREMTGFGYNHPWWFLPRLRSTRNRTSICLSLLSNPWRLAVARPRRYGLEPPSRPSGGAAPRITAHSLLNRGLTAPPDARRFLEAPLSGLHAPELLPGVSGSGAPYL